MSFCNSSAETSQCRKSRCLQQWRMRGKGLLVFIAKHETCEEISIISKNSVTEFDEPDQRRIHQDPSAPVPAEFFQNEKGGFASPQILAVRHSHVKRLFELSSHMFVRF